MGVGTLSAVTVQSGALTRAGIIGDGVEEARSLVRSDNIPAILPEISLDDDVPGTNLPGGSSEATGGSESAALDPVTDTGGQSGGGLHIVGVGSSTDPDTCPALALLPDEEDLECVVQDADDA